MTRTMVFWRSVDLIGKSNSQRLLCEQRSAATNIDTQPFFDVKWHYWDVKTIRVGLSALRKHM